MFADDQSPTQLHDRSRGASLPKVKHLPSNLCASTSLVLPDPVSVQAAEGERQRHQRHDVQHSIIDKSQAAEAVNDQSMVPQQVSLLLIQCHSAAVLIASITGNLRTVCTA